MGHEFHFENEWIQTLLGKAAIMKHAKFGAFLKSARKRRQLSQWEVAQKVGYSTAQFISNLERGISPPPLKVLKTLLELYQADAEDVIRIIEEEQTKNLKRNLDKLRKALR